MSAKTVYIAVVESGSCSNDFSRWGEIQSCGHRHKTYEAAKKCLDRQINARYTRFGWRASANWYCGGAIHNQHGERV